MPIYEYQADGEGCPKCCERFEVLQRMDEPALAACPDCGGPVQRLISSFAMTHGSRGTLSEKNLAKKGFTQYRKAGGGFYEKTCGQGPDVIKR